MAEERRYSEREVRAILERATQQENSDGLTHADLLAAAREAGISTDAVEKAALELDGLSARDEARDRILARRKAGFYSHLWAFIGVQVFLLALNLLVSPDHLWFLFPLLGWGLGLFFSARHGFSKEVSEHAISREMLKKRFVTSATRVVGALAQPSKKLRARTPPARVSETVLEHDVEPAPEASDAPDVTLPEAGRQRK
ncbi:MAG TPA: 2TM domain-containing protein [Polyangiaceae bacterium]|nr:2TM domain-containing protein [Polyangiaceae bacterium]